MNDSEFDPRELRLFFDRLERLFDGEQLIVGCEDENGLRRNCVVQLHLGLRPRDGKHAIVLDIKLEKP